MKIKSDDLSNEEYFDKVLSIFDLKFNEPKSVTEINEILVHVKFALAHIATGVFSQELVNDLNDCLTTTIPKLEKDFKAKAITIEDVSLKIRAIIETGVLSEALDA